MLVTPIRIISDIFDHIMSLMNINIYIITVKLHNQYSNLESFFYNYYGRFAYPTCN